MERVELNSIEEILADIKAGDRSFLGPDNFHNAVFTFGKLHKYHLILQNMIFYILSNIERSILHNICQFSFIKPQPTFSRRERRQN